MLSERLKTAMDAAGINQAELARLCGVSAPSVNGWLSGKSKFLRGENLLLAAKALNVSEQWLANGKGEMKPGPVHEVRLAPSPDLSSIRTVRLKLQAGVSGFAVEPFDNSDVPSIFFRNDWLRQREYDPANLLALKIGGMSMIPTIWPDDIVVVHIADTEPKDGEVYAVNYEGEAVIKRMKRERGSWWLSSDNADKARYPDKEFPDGSRFVIGHVVFRQSERI